MTQAWRVATNADLRARNTMGIAARAPVLVEVGDGASLAAALALPELRDGIALVLGAGSNVLFADDPDGAVLALRGERISVEGSVGRRTIVRAEAGLDWDACVRWTLGRRLGGLENLSLIPGTVGAAPIQNIGAYGVEVGELIHAVEALEPGTGRVVRLPAAECGFAYRDSRFKREPQRWIVTAVEFALFEGEAAPLRLGYAGIGEELAAAGVDAPRAADVAAAVVRLRRRKLPDPSVIGNAGSFFKNPVVPARVADALLAEHPRLPVFPAVAFPADAALHGDAPRPDEARKLSAAWLIDACGWKGHRDGDAGVSAGHALVLVNHGAATGAQLLALARRIAGSVHERFGVAIEPEPRIVGAAW